MNISEQILICIMPDELNLKVIEKGIHMSELNHSTCKGLYVDSSTLFPLSRLKRQYLSNALNYAKQINLDICIVSGNDIVHEIIHYAKNHRINKIVIGNPKQSSWNKKIYGNLVEQLILESEDIDVFVISAEDTPFTIQNLSNYQITSFFKQDHKLKKFFLAIKDYVLSLMIIFACTWISFKLFGTIDLANIIMLYILGVVYISYNFGAMPSTVASLSGVAMLDYLFVPHYFSFVIRDMQYLITLSVMLIVGMTIGKLTDNLNSQLKFSKKRESQTYALYSMSRELSSVLERNNLLKVICTHIGEVFHTKVLIFLPSTHAHRLDLRLMQSEFKEFYKISDEELEHEFNLIEWVFEHQLAMGLGLKDHHYLNKNFFIPLNHLENNTIGSYFPLITQQGIVGVIGFITSHFNMQDILKSSESRHLLETFINQSALAIERNRLATKTQEIQLEMMSERLKNALLNSISHDLNTPLSIISGSATTLLQARHSMNQEQEEELLQTIFDQSQSVSRLVRNLLYMTRLESGVLKINKEWQDLEELIGSVLNRLKSIIKQRPISVDIPIDFPLVLCDSVLISQILQNFLENALKYTDYPSPIVIRCSQHNTNIMIEVIDSGKGMPESELPKVFEKFYRGKLETTSHGNGLGLSICQGIIQLHDGEIWAKNNASGIGMNFGFSLPFEEMPEFLD